MGSLTGGVPFSHSAFLGYCQSGVSNKRCLRELLGGTRDPSKRIRLELHGQQNLDLVGGSLVDRLGNGEGLVPNRFDAVFSKRQCC